VNTCLLPHILHNLILSSHKVVTQIQLKTTAIICSLYTFCHYYLMIISHFFPTENATASSSAFLLRNRGVNPAITAWLSSIKGSLVVVQSQSTETASLHDDDTALVLCLSLLRHFVKLLLRFETRPTTHHNTQLTYTVTNANNAYKTLS